MDEKAAVAKKKFSVPFPIGMGVLTVLSTYSVGFNTEGILMAAFAVTMGTLVFEL